jgi:hypothetical protein
MCSTIALHAQLQYPAQSPENENVDSVPYLVVCAFYSYIGFRS